MASVHSLRVGIDARAAVAGAAQASGAMATVGTAAVTAGKKVQSFGNNLKYLAGGLIGLMVIRDIIKTVVDFEKTMKTVGIVTGETTKKLQEMSVVARRLGATTRFTATEAAEGMTFLARAGFKAEQVMKMIPHTLNLATAAVIDLGASSDMVANTIHQFSLEAGDAERVVDSFLITANNANTNVLQLGQALQYAGTFAGALSVPLEDTNAALGILADSGIKGSMAGTQMRGVFAALIKPTEKAEKALRALGLSVQDVNPAIMDLDEIFQNFAEAQSTMTDKTKFAGLMLDIFSRRPVAAALALAKMNEKLTESIQRQKDLAGETRRAALAMEDTMFGALKALRSAMQEAWLATGDAGFSGALRVLVDLMTGVVRVMAGMRDSVEKYNTLANVLALTMKILITRFVALMALKLIGMFYALALAVAQAIAGMLTLNAVMAMNPAVALATVISIVVVAFYEMADGARAAESAQKALNLSMASAVESRVAYHAAETYIEQLKSAQAHLDNLTETRKKFSDTNRLVEDNAGNVVDRKSVV